VRRRIDGGRRHDPPVARLHHPADVGVVDERCVLVHLELDAVAHRHEEVDAGNVVAERDEGRPRLAPDRQQQTVALGRLRLDHTRHLHPLTAQAVGQIGAREVGQEDGAQRTDDDAGKQPAETTRLLHRALRRTTGGGHQPPSARDR
jgi:hypothetical protein